MIHSLLAFACVLLLKSEELIGSSAAMPLYTCKIRCLYAYDKGDVATGSFINNEIFIILIANCQH